MRRICREMDRLLSSYNTAQHVYLFALERVMLSNAYCELGEALIAHARVEHRNYMVNKHYAEHGCVLRLADAEHRLSHLDKALVGTYFGVVGFAMFFLSLLINPG